ncbi:hypothetical protein [Aneurinibacillus tyrosinisolvens]|uniref:hypothetical protein n=1 Tax=Aneurinibacillus tyrosinisolvens TaxID=1443435 RepID=UPI00063F92DE|nr:hypothetical protein [Aneurinibacillus tyrosinisolvens]
MATFVKMILIAGVWTVFFLSSYFLFNSRAEEDMLTLQKAMNQVHMWESYESRQSVLLDKEEELHMDSISHQNPYLAQVIARARLTETEDFKFEVYFQPEVIYIHTLNKDVWNKTDYTHPAAGDLEGMRDPMAFWLRTLKHADEIIKEHAVDGGYHYSITLHPFRDEVHGIHFEDMKAASLEAWVTTAPLRVERMKLVIDFKPNLLRRYNQMTYSTEFSSVNRAATITLPKQSASAKKIK